HDAGGPRAQPQGRVPDPCGKDAMRPGVLIGWLLGLVLAAAASWLVWSFGPAYGALFPPLAEANERFGLALLPMAIWALLPVLFWCAFWRRRAFRETRARRAQRRAAVASLATRGIRGRRGRAALPIFLVAGPPGSGKSSILEQSGLVRGGPAEIGRTNWWAGP